jgi:hypothetical protein
MFKKNKKKAVVGLDVVEAVILSLLAIGILSITTILVLYSLLPSTDAISQTSGQRVINESGTMTSAGYTLAKSTLYGFSSPSIVTVTNTSNSVIIPSANYTLVGNKLYNSTVVAQGGVYITYDYKISNSGASSIINNISEGNTSFFGNSSTFFSILAVVVIIALIALIVLYIRQFRSEGRVNA